MMELMHVAMVAAGVVTVAHIGYRWLSHEGTKIDRLVLAPPPEPDEEALPEEPQAVAPEPQPLGSVFPDVKQLREYEEQMGPGEVVVFKGKGLQVRSFSTARFSGLKVGKKIKIVTTYAKGGAGVAAKKKAESGQS